MIFQKKPSESLKTLADDFSNIAIQIVLVSALVLIVFIFLKEYLKKWFRNL